MFSKSTFTSWQNYYPFGLTYNSYSRENTVSNDIKFQGQEHIDDLNLGWDSFKWRNHQPDIGRFFNVDPLADKYLHNSPYAFSENKVTSHVELEGLEAWDIKFTDGSSTKVHGPFASQSTAESFVDDQMSVSPVPAPKIVSGVNLNRKHPVKQVIRPHNGVDIHTTDGPTDGAPVVAPLNGTVVAKGNSDSFGNHVNIKSSIDGKIHKLNHMQDGSTDKVKVNDKVKRGQSIGKVGTTGLSSGPHMHYEIRGATGKVYDPVKEIPALNGDNSNNKTIVPKKVTKLINSIFR
jgi:RHS repeat-associated protein